MGGAHNLLFILSGHFNGLTDKWQLITGDHMVIHWAVSNCKREYTISDLTFQELLITLFVKKNGTSSLSLIQLYRNLFTPIKPNFITTNW